MPIMKVSLGDGPIDFSSARRFALVSAFLKIICTLLLVIIIAIDTTSTGVNLNCQVDCDNSNALYTLDACCLRQGFAESRRFSWLNFFFDIMEFISAFLFVAPMLALADVWGRRITTNKLMVAAFAASAGISLLEFLFRAGSNTTVNWIADWVVMDTDDQAIRMLAVASRVANGQGLWAFAADDLFLGVGLMCAAYLTFKFGQLPRGHAWLGAITGALSVINFGLELGRFGEWRIMSIVSSITYAVVGFLLLPAWLIYLACFLGEYVEPDTRTGLTTNFGGSDETSLPSGAYRDATDDNLASATVTATAGTLASQADKDDSTL